MCENSTWLEATGNSHIVYRLIKNAIVRFGNGDH